MSLLSSGRPSASDIEHRIRDALLSDGPDSAPHIWVTINGSRAMLHGSVRSSADLRLAKLAAGSSPDVGNVVNAIEIRP